MAQVESFGPHMIESFVKSNGLKYLTDSDGDFHIHFAYDEEADCAIQVVLIAGGPRRDIYSIRVSGDKRIPPPEWPRALTLCNQWNRARLWPKAYLDTGDADDSNIGYIRLEFDLDCEKGIHQELLDDMTHIMIIGGNQFWKWFGQQQ